MSQNGNGIFIKICPPFAYFILGSHDLYFFFRLLIVRKSWFSTHNCKKIKFLLVSYIYNTIYGLTNEIKPKYGHLSELYQELNRLRFSTEFLKNCVDDWVIPEFLQYLTETLVIVFDQMKFIIY